MLASNFGTILAAVAAAEGKVRVVGRSRCSLGGRGPDSSPGSGGPGSTSVDSLGGSAPGGSPQLEKEYKKDTE